MSETQDVFARARAQRAEARESLIRKLAGGASGPKDVAAIVALPAAEADQLERDVVSRKKLHAARALLATVPALEAAERAAKERDAGLPLGEQRSHPQRHEAEDRVRRARMARGELEALLPPDLLQRLRLSEDTEKQRSSQLEVARRRLSALPGQREKLEEEQSYAAKLYPQLNPVGPERQSHEGYKARAVALLERIGSLPSEVSARSAISAAEAALGEARAAREAAWREVAAL